MPPATSTHKYGILEAMKTTLEIPDLIFKRAKSKAAQQGMPLREFVTQAVEEKLRIGSASASKPWMKIAGKLRHLRSETARVNKVIEEEFENIEPEDWR